MSQTPSVVSLPFDLEPTRRVDEPASCFLAILNYEEDAQQFHKSCSKAGMILRVLGGNVLLVFSWDSPARTGELLKAFARPRYEFGLVALGSLVSFK